MNYYGQNYYTQNYYTHMDSVMEDLVGKTVSKVEISSGEEVLVVTHDSGRSVYETEGDCCSQTWIADIVGVANLIGHKVIKVESLEVNCVDDGRTRQEVDSFYGIKLHTTGGYVDIVYRNSSNGYYGGSMNRVKEERLRKSLELRSITEDFSA